MHWSYRFALGCVFLVYSSWIPLASGAELEDVRVSATEFRVDGQSVETPQIHLDTTEEQLPQTFMQAGGTIRADQLLIDNGSYDIRGGTLTVDYLGLGDPSSDRIQTQNFGGGSILMSAEEPVTLKRLDFRSRDGLLGVVDLSDQSRSFDFSPFDTIVSSTPHRLTIESAEPFEMSHMHLPIAYSGFDPGDLTVSFGGEPSDLTLSTSVRQSGGEVNVMGNLELCVPPAVVMTLYDQSEGTYEEMRYELTDGSLTVGGDMVVGSLGAAPTRVVQSGGSSRIDGTLEVSGLTSQVQLLGGRMEVDRLNVDSFFELGDAELVVTEQVWLDGSGIVAASESESPKLMLDGAYFRVLPDDFGNDFVAANLGQIDFHATGADQTTAINLFHWDEGESPKPREANRSSLFIGDETEPAHVRLVDDFGSGNEALYLDRLVLAPGSTLHVNDFNVYYNELELGEGAEIIEGEVPPSIFTTENCYTHPHGPYLLDPDDLRCIPADHRDSVLDFLDVTLGDLDLDGEVAFSDFLILSSNFGNDLGGYTDGDLNRDGEVGFEDFLVLSANYGRTGSRDWEFISPEEGWESEFIWEQSAVFPEPATTTFMLPIACIVGCWRRRRTQ